MSSNADSLVRDAIAAYRAGSKEQARNLLLQAVELDERHEQGWLWLSAVVDSVEDQITCLENVLTVNPGNQKALQGLQMLNEKLNSKPAPPPPSAAPAPAFTAADDDPFANVSFTQPVSDEPEPPAAAPASTSDDQADELPSGVTWGTIETSSASALPPTAEPPPEVYSDWIAGLNIGSNDATETFGPTEGEDAMFGASPFIGDDMFAGDEPFQLDKSVFGIDDDELDLDDMSAGPFTASPFSADTAESETTEKPAPPPAMPISPQPAPVPLSSPSPAAARSDDKLLADIESDDFFSDEDFLDNDYGSVDLGTVDPDEYFRYIPSEIKATRLPGTKERYPVLVTLSLVLLVLLNAGAVALVYMTLTRT